MGLNAAMDVAIGLVLMYVCLSLVCTTINELLATVLSWRARTLAAQISRMVDDPGLRSAFYDNGLVRSAHNVSLFGGPGAHPSYLAGADFAMALLASLDVNKPLPAFEDIQQAVIKLPTSGVRDSLLCHLASAQSSLDHLRNGIAVGYDQAMDRLAGAYQRRLKGVSFMVGLVLSLGLNADSVLVSNALWHDSAVRQETVSLASNVALGNVAQDPSPSRLLPVLADVKAADEALRPLPLGWQAEPAGGSNWQWVLKKLLGIMLTTLALTLGAPFWFDVLSKMVNLRGTGRKPDRTLAV
jgi:hypothetical protein